MKYSEAEILEAVNSKDKILYKRLYECYYSSLSHYASKICRNAVSEEDIVQDVLLKFWESHTRFENSRALTTYLFRAVYNACLNALRDKRKNSPLTDMYATVDFEAFRNECLLVEEEYFRQIYIAIDSLGEQRRQVILKSLEGMNREEIAASLGISVNTVKTLKRKAYEELRDKLPAPLFVFLLTCLG